MKNTKIVVKVGTFREEFLGATKTLKDSKLARKAINNLDVRRTGKKKKGSLVFSNQAAYDKAGKRLVDEYRKVAKNNSGLNDINKTTVSRSFKDLI